MVMNLSLKVLLMIIHHWVIFKIIQLLLGQLKIMNRWKMMFLYVL